MNINTDPNSTDKKEEKATESSSLLSGIFDSALEIPVNIGETIVKVMRRNDDNSETSSGDSILDNASEMLSSAGETISEYSGDIAEGVGKVVSEAASEIVDVVGDVISNIDL